MTMILPVEDGEGDQAKPGGGVADQACSICPSTTLRVVPLPAGGAGREDE
ncbi:MAG TPA: hypothetical protein VD846_10615 [Allosphingosinicella sp.]|nr:hypothetical protein [Allosphingosinicella sp.]